MKLYYIPTTRAQRPRWLLEEIGVPYELINVTLAETQELEYRKLHPHGKVPVLVDGDVTIFESAAICMYLADQYLEKKFAPAINTPARGYYYQWLFYGAATLEPPVEQFMFNVLPNLPEKVLPVKQRTKMTTEESKIWFDRVGEPLRIALINQNYLIENSFTAADVIIGGILLWALRLKMLSDHDPLKTYLEKLMQRPAFQRADANFHHNDT